MKVAAAFLLAAVSAALAQVPTPESVLGHKPGDDFYLATYDDALGYFQKLAHSTDKLKLVHVGKTTQGREWDIAIISSAKNLANLDTYKDTARKLALVKGLTEEQAHDAGPHRQGDRAHRRRTPCHRGCTGPDDHPACLQPGDGQ